MCGSIRQLGCSKTLQQVWNGISAAKYNTKRLVVIRNDKIIYDRGGTLAYYVYSATKGLLGGPTLVHAMSKCGVGLNDRAGQWLGHGQGSRWESEFPWSEITLEHLATHTSGVCDYGNSSTICRDEHPGWQAAFERTKVGGAKYVYPNDAFTIARVQAEQNREPARAPGSVLEYSNVAHALLNYAVQQACGLRAHRDLRPVHQAGGNGLTPRRGAHLHRRRPAVQSGDGTRPVEGARRRGGAAPGGTAGDLGQPEHRAGALLASAHPEPPATSPRRPRKVGAWSTRTTRSTSGPSRWATAGFERDVRPRRQPQHDLPERSADQYDRGAAGRELRQRRVPHPQRLPSGMDRNGPDLLRPAPARATTGATRSVYTGQRKMVMEPLQEAFFFPPPFCRMRSRPEDPMWMA